MKILTFSIFTMLISACATHQPQVIGPDYSTQECKTYHFMSTAPMDPRAVESLKIKCDESLLKIK